MKFLIVRFSSIGDVVLTTPVIRCLKQQVPNAEIHFITKQNFKAVLENNPYIDQLILIQHSIDEVLENLKSNEYDFIVDLHHNIRTLRLKRTLKKPAASFPKKNIEKFLLTQFKIDRLPRIHVVDRYFETLKQFGVKPDGKGAELFLNEKDDVDLQFYNLQSHQFIAVSMGAQFATKQMPIDLLHRILKNIDFPIVLLGGNMDTQKAAELTQLLPEQTIINLTGIISLRQSAFMLKECAVVLTGDTGLMHIASCFGKPIVSVWGNTVPEFGMSAYYPTTPNLSTMHEVEGLKCRPCSKIGYQTCPKKHFKCMNLQDVKAIQNSILKIIHP